jgi:acetylornithine/succinyldiaminopimelate/putrescine aminotransferase
MTATTIMAKAFGTGFAWPASCVKKRIAPLFSMADHGVEFRRRNIKTSHWHLKKIAQFR